MGTVIEDVETRRIPPDDGYVQFRSAGDEVQGAFRCSGCGYGVSVYTSLPTCPMCSGGTWEQSPFTRYRLRD